MSESKTINPTPQRPADILLNLIVTLLTPMFLSAAGGDLRTARLAAAGTLDAYRIETRTDLITIAKIIAFGLATLGTLCLSMADDLPIPTVLRLRANANANASDRSEHRNRLLLDQPQSRTQAPRLILEPDIDHPAPAATIAETQPPTAQNPPEFQPSAPVKAQADNEKHYQATWAACTAAIAAETAASLPNLPPEERETAALWVEVLNDVSNSFLTEGIPPRPKPGDLAAMMGGG